MADATLFGLRGALGGEIEVEADTLALSGLSVSAADTTLSFPDEFGVFDRFDLDRELAVRLQSGLPRGTAARIAVAAADPNYVNWVRGGEFNPSGAVRVPSLHGEGGTGVFGALVRRRVDIETGSAAADLPACAAAR
ncbi:MAG: hypothetical protein D6701_00910 [Gemmatimonadetes bacterium]|nr:MAG: hypothetical protein D6701_00910 [Gemmatimonadota bacterium]